MSNLESALENLKEDLLEMAGIVRNQLKQCKVAIENNDHELAQEVIRIDKEINDLELKIDKNSEKTLALYNPVAVDLRFVLATLKSNHDLERIGDNIRSIAKASEAINTKLEYKLADKFRVMEMFDIAISIIDDAYRAIEQDDTDIARRIFEKDSYLDVIDKDSMDIAAKLCQEYPEESSAILAIYTVAKKLERIGDLSRNLAEEIIFHIDARVLKHKKNQKKKA